MSDIALRVEGLGKRYHLGLQDNANSGMYRYKSLRDSLGGWARRSLSTVRQMPAGAPIKDNNVFWALRDISFEVKRGEVVGIIGRNGAGKSTLLKILSRITKPTAGRIDLYGRVGSLLEVGTGFHPELSGRENIYLNGAILGMTRAEVRGKFDEIVAFSEVERFIDTPVKNYSSGMYMRLAFAVAANLNTEILIVDEVLAVGDSEFQNKCIDKMRRVSNDGRTVLFVSHNLAAIENLCTSGVLLQLGNIISKGSVTDTLRLYGQMRVASQSKSLARRVDRSGSGAIRITGMRIEDRDSRVATSVRSGSTVKIVIEYKIKSEAAVGRVDFGISLSRLDHNLLTVMYSSFEGKLFDQLPQLGEISSTIEMLPLAAGTYKIGTRVLVDGVEADWPDDDVGELIVEPGNFYTTGSIGHGYEAPLLLRATWEYSTTRRKSIT